jgi:NADPH-dependent ferric siderophore reductase
MTLQDIRPRHQSERVRRDTRRRTLTVASVAALTPKMLRMEFTSPDLADFFSGAPDDHVKLIVPAPGGEAMRDYTPRRFDPARRSLTIDFAIHDEGPATLWALAAQVGDQVQIGGPRGSLVVPDDFDWYLLVADETGLPAVGRRLEELRAGVPALSLVLVDDAREAQAIETRTDWRPQWLRRDAEAGSDAERLLGAVRALQLPPGDGYVWIAAEASVAKTLRDHFLEERGHPAPWMRAAGYWLRGAAGKHAHLD